MVDHRDKHRHHVRMHASPPANTSLAVPGRLRRDDDTRDIRFRTGTALQHPPLEELARQWDERESRRPQSTRQCQDVGRRLDERADFDAFAFP